MRELIIIGAGIAGITAAIYAKRKGMNFLLISEDFAGQLKVAGQIENYPGLRKTNMNEMMENLRKQMEDYKIRIVYQKVREVKKKKDYFEVICDKKAFLTKSIIIATGARARELNAEGEKNFIGFGLTYCAVCDGPLFKNKEVAVIGGGDGGLEAAEFLLKIARKIYLLTLEKITAQKILERRVLSHKKVKVIEYAEVKKILGEKFVNGLEYLDLKTKKLKKLKVEGIFVEIGRVPNTEIFKNLVKLDFDQHIIINQKGETSCPGIFAAGDCTNSHEYQLIIAAGQGALALLKAARYLQRK